jgi:hypothetical protein
MFMFDDIGPVTNHFDLKRLVLAQVVLSKQFGQECSVIGIDVIQTPERPALPQIIEMVTTMLVHLVQFQIIGVVTSVSRDLSVLDRQVPILVK